jgi:predicted transcriptional regulator
MRHQSQHVRDDADARAERAVILHLLDPEHHGQCSRDDLARAINDATIDRTAVEGALARLARLGLVAREGDQWHASRGLVCLDRLGLIGV